MLRRFRHTRESFIPAGAVKVADKASDAVAYIYERAGVPYGMAFAGKAQKPALNFRFRTIADRERRISEFFAGRRASLASKAERRANRKRLALKVGDVLYTSWGYDQTNVEFFEVTAMVGASMVELRELAQEREQTGAMQGTCTPKVGVYVGDAMRRRIGESGVTVDDCRRAWPWDGRPRSWSSYA
jgi:hypothetical protein